MPEVVLGFDYGTHKIGVASGQTLTQTASPLTTLFCRHGQPDWQQVAVLLQTWRPNALIVGHPFEMTDQEANHAPAAKKFARRLHGRFHLPVYLVDERLTTREAWSQLGSTAAKDVTKVDALAAKLIIETWFSQVGDQAAANPLRTFLPIT
jgi:putative Holliday junction resolvase